jgi:hypothetical protein
MGSTKNELIARKAQRLQKYLNRATGVRIQKIMHNNQENFSA